MVFLGNEDAHIELDISRFMANARKAEERMIELATGKRFVHLRARSNIWHIDAPTPTDKRGQTVCGRRYPHWRVVKRAAIPGKARLCHICESSDALA